MTKYLLAHIDNQGVATITLNRSDVHNAFDNEMVGGLRQILEEYDADPAVRVVKLAASGKSFSAGADLNWMRRMAHYSPEENLTDALDLADLFQVLARLSKPTIALVPGPAIGGGVGLVAACDIAISSKSAFFQLSEVKLGLIPAVVSPYVMSAIGTRAARRYFLTGERFSAKEALRLGLVHEVVAKGKLAVAADSFCNHLLHNGPQAMAAVKGLVHHFHNAEQKNKMLTETAKRIAKIRMSAEGQEGIKAFLDKREPSWNKNLNG